ncbi:hypothetical protein NXV86_26625 [Bacteroides sp. BFG-257]|uniref:hypothetical protein n=1 Tax=Bacteroides TaxID=816 RepID=UPI001CCC1500|nr:MULTISPECIES: hypothetical protein [Bacteroides]UBD69677.1 hypothetical protein K6V21_25525 [Bacteroides cellulosilyticus]UVO98323.1 hypothetical protein NXV86_26625 [Bacteroides sp. BFG-257]
MNKILKYISLLFSAQSYTLRNFTTFLLLLFCIQYIPIESRAGVSWLKVAVMAICPFIFLLKTAKISKALYLATIYLSIMWIVSLIHYETFRASTLIYTTLFLLLYATYYNLLYCNHVFDIDYFIKLLKGLILAYSVCLLIQQFFILIGIVQFPIINLVQVLNRSFGANSLSFEPSSSARIMAVAYLGLLRMYELKKGRLPNIKELFQELRWSSIGFLWAMSTMDSGTAFVALGILSILFIKRQYLLSIVPTLIAIYFIIPSIEFEPLQRARNAVEVTLTLETESVIETDGSAATRITPLINTIKNIDLFNLNSWVGYGADYVKRFKGPVEQMKKQMIGRIQEFGLFSFIIMQMLIFSCAIRKVLSVETLLWLFLFSMTFGNVSYTWGAIMIFTAVRYFQEQYEQELLVITE